jgi:hypothetical protein
VLDGSGVARETNLSPSRHREENMATEPDDGSGQKGIDPNHCLLVGLMAYVVVNFIAILLLLAHAFSDVFGILFFFSFPAPLSASVLAMWICLSLKRRFHPLALIGFVIVMIFAGWLHFQFFARAAAAV